MSCTTTAISEIVYIGCNNAIDLQLQDDTAVPGTFANTSLATASKVSVTVGGTTYDSSANPTIISYTLGGIVTIKLGTTISVPGVYKAYIKVYDVINTSGVLWDPPIYISAQQ